MARRRDLAELQRAFAAIPAAIKAKVQPAIDKGADELVARMKHLAPVDDGKLVASVHTEPGPVELSRTVVADDEAALFQEFGTAAMPRNSFFFPSINTAKARIRRRIDRAIGKAIKDTYK